MVLIDFIYTDAVALVRLLSWLLLPFLAANLLWNNMMQPVGSKSETSMDFIMKDFVCPTIDSPYIFTANNSAPLDHRNTNKLRWNASVSSLVKF